MRVYLDIENDENKDSTHCQVDLIVANSRFRHGQRKIPNFGIFQPNFGNSLLKIRIFLSIFFFKYGDIILKKY